VGSQKHRAYTMCPPRTPFPNGPVMQGMFVCVAHSPHTMCFASPLLLLGHQESGLGVDAATWEVAMTRLPD